MNYGTWYSQYNQRLLCGARLDAIPTGYIEDVGEVLPSNLQNYPDTFQVGTSLSQVGPEGWCTTFSNTPNYNSQMEYESPSPGILSGSNDYAHSSDCAGNALLNATVYPGVSQVSGLDGYQSFMSWIKAEVIKGNMVAIGVLIQGGEDSQYDHEVTVVRIGTNHDVTDSTYYSDDVLYFEDHGCFAINFKTGRINSGNPSIPPGVEGDDNACTPYVFGYAFGDLPKSRQQANQARSNLYSLVLPGATGLTQQGEWCRYIPY